MSYPAHLLLSLLLGAPPSNLKVVANPGLRVIRGDALSAHIRFLADDLLEGRGTGTRGHSVAARYIATQLQSLGYQPAGERQTYFQSVPLIAMKVTPETSTFELDGTPLKYPEQVLFSPRAGSSQDDVTGELVFAGYGISAPLYGYEDAPKDLHGKIAVILFGAPRSSRLDFFPAAASAVYTDTVEKTKRLASRGALGAVLIYTPEIAAHLPWEFSVRQASFERMVWREGDRPGSGYALPVATLPTTGLTALLAKSGRNADEIFAAAPKGGLKAFSLGLRGRLRITAAVRQLTSENVAAVLRGGERPSECVAVTAHLDHLGIGPAINGDSIYNGAGDDAAGVAGVLEVARAFASLPQRPLRSILILAVTGEEKGLLGSDYFARHPTVPIQSIVADVNLDGPSGAWEPHDLVALGAEHSTLDAAVRAATRAQHLKISPDPEPEQVFFIRSDQYSFVKQGVPSVFPNVGWQDAAGKIEKNKAYDHWWTQNRYHQPSDEWDPKLNYENMAKEVRADFLIVLAIALDPERPRWNRGDVFEKLFGFNGAR
jgi:hypothetical protein